jgi:hypothetical protein
LANFLNRYNWERVGRSEMCWRRLLREREIILRPVSEERWVVEFRPPSLGIHSFIAASLYVAFLHAETIEANNWKLVP